MKNCVLLLVGILSTVAVNAQKVVHPLIEHFGAVTEVPFADIKPDPSLDYKIVAEVVSDNPHPERVHEFFDKVAAVANLHILGGVPKNKLHLVMVIHGPAAAFVVNNEVYRKNYGMDNPNLPLFAALKEAGVQILVCGQSMNKHNLTREMIAPEIQVSLSAITALTTYQLQGYAVLRY
jgi:intracellular sulfur oxidation DsrE/DsrF family protein